MSLMDDELTAGGFSYKEVFRPQEKLLMGLGWVVKINVLWNGIAFLHHCEPFTERVLMSEGILLLQRFATDVNTKSQELRERAKLALKQYFRAGRTPT